MNQKRTHAFTLIELLIVVAILAILASASVAYIILPQQEQLRAVADMERETGLGGLFAKLVADAHNATSLTTPPGGRALILNDCGPATSAVYFVDTKNSLRRALITPAQAASWTRGEIKETKQIPAAFLAAGVQSLEADPLNQSGLWRIRITLSTPDPHHPSLERHLEVRCPNS